MIRRPIRRVALTGGIASGKSVCLRRFAALGAPVIDADVVAREVVVPDSPALAAIVDRFGPRVLESDGTLDRAGLGRIVFGDASARADLERIVHPDVYDRIEAWFTGQQTDDARRPAIADIPLLFETGHQDRFDCVIVAACSSAQQHERLTTRDRLTPEDAQRRIAAQWPIDTKRTLGDLVIDTGGTMAETHTRVDQVWAELTR